MSVSQPWLSTWGSIHNLRFYSTLIRVCHVNALPTVSKKKTTFCMYAFINMFCFYKGREPKICTLGFISNPYKNACLERILIKFPLEMTDRYNQPVWSQFLLPHKMLTVCSNTTRVYSDAIGDSIYKFAPLLELRRVSPWSFLYIYLCF